MTTNEFLERARDLYGQAEKELQFKAQDYQGAYENALHQCWQAALALDSPEHQKE